MPNCQAAPLCPTEDSMPGCDSLLFGKQDELDNEGEDENLFDCHPKFDVFAEPVPSEHELKAELCTPLSLLAISGGEESSESKETIDESQESSEAENAYAEVAEEASSVIEQISPQPVVVVEPSPVPAVVAEPSPALPKRTRK